MSGLSHDGSSASLARAEARFEQAALTDRGRVRQHNEDSMLARPDVGLWAVADGMGGHENGQWASGVIVEALEAVRLTGAFEADLVLVRDTLAAANDRIFQSAIATGVRMGSTAVVLLVTGGRAAVAWAGDSRAYLLRKGELKQLSKDHSQVQHMVDEGRLTPDEARNHPMASVLTRAVGVEAGLAQEHVVEAAETGDVFLLCSDGLTGPVSDEEIRVALKSLEPALAAQALLDMALARGAPDNVTVVIVACRDITLLPPREGGRS